MCIHGGLRRLRIDGLLLRVHGHGGDLSDIDDSSTLIPARAAADQSVGVCGSGAFVVCWTAPCHDQQEPSFTCACKLTS